MKIYTVKEFQERWEEMIDRVENGESIGIINEKGQTAVMIPADDELIRMYTDHEEGCWSNFYGTVAYWLKPSAYNGVNGVQFPAVLLLL